MTPLHADAPPVRSADSFDPAKVARLIGVWASRPAGDGDLQRRRDRWFTAAVMATTLAVYLRSLLPGIGYSGDVAKWQYMSETGGIPHATGYPLWVAMIQAWGDIVPWGTPAWKTNLLSAVLGVVAVGVLFRLLRVLGVRRTVAAATALTFAVTPTFWSQASIAEVYTLHILFMASITLCLARWRLGASNRWLLAGMAIFALALGHHMMIVLMLPGMAWLVWSDRQRGVTLGNAAWVALFGVLGVSQYLYLLYMNDVGGYVEVPTHDLAGLWDLVRGGEFKDEMWGFSLYQYLESRLPLLGTVVGAEYLFLQAPMAYGIWAGLRAERTLRDVTILVFLVGAMSTIFATNYDVPDIGVFFIPLLFVLAVFLGLGLERAVAWAHRHYPDHQRLVWGMAAALVMLPLIVGVANYRRASQRGNLGEAQRIERALAVVDEGTMFVTNGYRDQQYLSYYFRVDGVGEERNLAIAGRVSNYQIARYLRGQRGEVRSVANTIEGVANPPVVTANNDDADELRDDGFTLTSLAEDVWLVTLPDGVSADTISTDR
jgi:hypothetical protein